jgi:hypothetical protein
MPMQRERRGARKLASLLILIVSLAAVAGCRADNSANGGGGNGIRSQHYSNDGYLGLTSSYPHVPGRHMTLNYDADAAAMRDAIRNVRGVGSANITFQGAEAFVTVKLRPDLGASQIPTVEREAASVLRFNFPRYVIHVRSLR